MAATRTYQMAMETGPILHYYQNTSIDNDKDISKLMDKFKKVHAVPFYASIREPGTSVPCSDQRSACVWCVADCKG